MSTIAEIAAACETAERVLGIGSTAPANNLAGNVKAAPVPVLTSTPLRMPTSSRMIDAARSVSPTLLAELDAAEPYTDIPPDHDGWRDEWLFPLATAARRDPKNYDRYCSIFDRGNRRSADPAKASETYFAKALTEFDAAVAAIPERPKQPEGVFRRTSRWDGLTSAHCAAGVSLALASAASAIAPTTTVVAADAFVSRTPNASFFSRIKFDAPDLHPVDWLVLGLLLRGEITVLSALGGGAKTAFAVCLAVTLASGLTNVGPFKVNNRPEGLRVAFISAEEDANRLGLLIAAACNVLALNATERARVQQNLFLHDAQASGWQLGAPRRGEREDICPPDQDSALSELSAVLAGVDVLMMDNLAALFGLQSENDNRQIASLMRRLIGTARQAGCAVLLLHHTPKMTRETAATLRGEASLVRGGGAIVNSSRVVWTITSPPDAEAAAIVMAGLRSDTVRRLEHAKINDAPPMEPSYVEIVSEKVKVHDGSEHAVRAIRFISPPATSGGFTDADRNLAMVTIDAGAQDEQGARVPFSPGSSGRGAKRDPHKAVADALMSARGMLTEGQAKHLARDLIKELRERGCVVEQDVKLPKYKSDGQRDGFNTRRGLVCRWDLAHWHKPVPVDEEQVAPVTVPDCEGGSE